MYDIIDFVMENANSIESYDVNYYNCPNDDVIGEVVFFLKNGDNHIFQIC